MLTSLISNINILAASGIVAALLKALLWIVQCVYWGVSQMFAIFMTICQINLSVVIGMMADLINRAKALVIVFVVYKLAYALISKLNDPNKGTEDTKKILINVLVAAAMLLTYNLVFDVMNELSMMIIGKPDNYHYTRLSAIAGATDEADEGLLIRMFFGTNGNVPAKDAQSIGEFMALKTLCASFPDTGKSTCNTLEQKVLKKGGKTDLKRLGNIVPYLDKEVDGHPFIALGLGLYIIYSIGKAAIKVGIRMFKLLILQIIAPIAIVTIIGPEGTKAKIFSNFIKAYVQVFLSAITQIGAIFLVTVFVSNFLGNFDLLFSSAKAGSGSTLTGVIAVLIIIYAAYQFAGELPKFIEDILGKSFGGDFGGKGFGQFLTQAATIPIAGAGALAGGIGGSIAAAREGGGFKEAAVGGFAGAADGFSGAFKGSGIKDKIAAVNKASTEGAQNRAVKIGEMGAGAYLAGAGLSRVPFMRTAQDQKVERFDREAAKYDKKSGKYDELSKLADQYASEQNALLAKEQFGSLAGFNIDSDKAFKDMGSDDNSIVDYMVSHNDEFNAANDYYNGIVNGDSAYINKYFKEQAMETDGYKSLAAARTNATTAEERAAADSNIQSFFDTYISRATAQGYDKDAIIAEKRNALNAAREHAKAQAKTYVQGKKDSLESENLKTYAQQFNDKASDLGESITLESHGSNIKTTKEAIQGKKDALAREKYQKVDREKEIYTSSGSYKNLHDFNKTSEKK